MRTFGLELEVHLPANRSRRELAAFIAAQAGVICREEGYGHSVPTAWKVVTDASLGYGTGAEVVSPILRGEAGIEQARKVAQAITDFGCRVRVDCGMHLHVGAADLDVRKLRNIAKCFVKFEAFFDNIMPASRRASANRYVMSNRSFFGGYGDAAANRGLEMLDRATSIPALINAFGGSRYFKLNLTSLMRQPTIEFRQHSGTTSPDKVEHWVRLVLAFVEQAAVSRPRARTVSETLTPAVEMARFFAMFDVPAATRAFYIARRRELHRDAQAA